MVTSNKKGILFVISGPSGAGKTTLVKEAIKRVGNKIERVITYTSRPPRPQEIDGEDYHFISPEEFTEKMHNGFFIETTAYISQHYASPTSLIDNLALGLSRVIVTDLPGAKALTQQISEAIPIWISVPSLATLKHRLEKRKETPSQITKRLEQAKQEMKEIKGSHRLFKYYVINEEFDRSVAELVLILKENVS